MATVLGTAVNFAFKSTTNGITVSGSGIGSLTLQSSKYSKSFDTVERIRNGAGVTTAIVGEDLAEKATLEYVIIGTGLADALTQTTIPAPLTIVTISACVSNPNLVDTNWFVVDEPVIDQSNTTAAKVTLNLEQRAAITAAASA